MLLFHSYLPDNYDLLSLSEFRVPPKTEKKKISLLEINEI